MKKKPDTIQHYSGIPEPTEESLKQGVDAGFRLAFSKKGRKMPKVSNCEIAYLSVDTLDMIAEW